MILQEVQAGVVVEVRKKWLLKRLNQYSEKGIEFVGTTA
jgi:hypothetical protein